MGSFRLILALLVLASHVGIYVWHRNEGVFAVASFFLLSGYVMTAQIRKHYDDGDKIVHFYFDRLLRLYPQFLLYLALTLSLLAFYHPKSHWLSEITLAHIILNVLLVPMDFHWMIGLSHGLLIPQTWTLGLEVQFYLLLPLLLLYRIRRPALLLSLPVFALAFFHLLDPVSLGYRWIPGTLFIFLCGSLLYDADRIRDTRLLPGVWLFAAALFAACLARPELQGPYVPEVLSGFLLGLPIVAVLKKRNFGPLDDLLGNLSYGVFLNHWLLIWICQAFKIELETAAAKLLFAAASILLAWISYKCVEKPVIAYRNRKRDVRSAVLHTSHLAYGL